MLVKEVGNLFQNQSEAEERKMLQVLLQEASWKAGVLQMSLREPFATLCNPR
jgi:hypothetical protein